ncbi:outer membrane protein assembly factor BamE domain-containing protein [Pseudoblastomonas halimionae]|uniref:Outer membrane protein assembly factor BamE n=1 Tax=Alteriqipengyuania halimionae TaxID=1926630 RepID=A0A6I4U0Y4_9SPHN|nr:outer membrane protein assembly factor BamE [Alteriqipengyuania halimionae]MXP09630.1 outer membrane protein assembly factor BamE [Alteriqipengyuania halimionae]
MLKKFAIGAALMCAGCVSMGTDYDATAVDHLQVGMNKQQVIEMLGQPNQVIDYADGSQRLVWVHSTGSMFGANARSVGLPFGPDGKLTDVPN